MPLVVSDEMLQSAGLTASEAQLELACRLFQTGKLDLWPAAQLAGLSRVEMEEALIERGIPIYAITEQDVAADLETIRKRELRRQQL